MGAITKERERVETVFYLLSFEDTTCPGAGWGFPCDAQGNVFTEGFCPEAFANLERCRQGGDHIGKGRIERYHNVTWNPAECECDACGATVILYDTWATPCDRCGTEYNGSGQRLAPREQWGEETGERF